MCLIVVLLLCFVAPGATFVAKVAPSAPSKSRLGRHDDGTWSSSSAFSGRRRLFPHALRVCADGGGRDDTPGENYTELRAVDKKVDAVEEDIQAVGREIGSVGEKIEAVEAALSGGPPYLGITDGDLLLEEKQQLREEKNQLRKEKEQLREEKEQLREEKEQLREKELLLLKKQPAAAVSLAVPKPLADFGAVLTRAVVTENTLELADGTFFLGEPRLRSKLYIRPCYKYLSKLILEGVINGMTDKIVVTGTPGIGKSEFGFYLMHLLRCRGKTVVLERKGAWYRFSDEGVTQGYHVDFGRAGYLQDTNTWFLSDPEDKPKEILGLPTVVLVSPRTSRVNEFMKQPDSFRFYMPVWSLEELFECQRAVFPHVPETDVRERFGKVGGVARAVFHANRLEELCAKMQTAASNMDLNLMQQILSRRRGDPDQLSTDKSGDTLLHMTVVPETGFKEFKVDFASEYAHNLTLAEIPKKEFAVLASFVRSAFANDELGTKVGAHRAEAFEILAHNTIGGAGKQQGFDMRILSSANSSTESVLEGDDWMFSFSEQKSFEGKSLPDTVVTGTYYRPLIQNFPAIDSFGVDSGSKTLWLFQMKSAGLPPRTGGKAVKWNYVEENWSSAKLAHGVPIKNCVFAFVVPEGKVWNKAIKTSEKDVGCGDWLLNVTDGFKSACDVCVIKIPL